MKENSWLSLRTPEPTSLSRSTAFNKHNVSEFFSKLREVYEKHSIKADRIWNIDETEVKNVHKPEKIIALKGTKQIAERGTTVPVCGGINAAGNHIPPYFIFPRVNWQPRMLNGAPPRSDGTASVSGWITGPLFLKFMHHFVRFCNPRDDEKSF